MIKKLELDRNAHFDVSVRPESDFSTLNSIRVRIEVSDYSAEIQKHNEIR